MTEPQNAIEAADGQSLLTNGLAQNERDVIVRLIAVARAAYFAADNCEECEGDDGELVFSIDADSFHSLAEALDGLDELPDDRPNITMTGPARAEWILGANAPA